MLALAAATVMSALAPAAASGADYSIARAVSIDSSGRLVVTGAVSNSRPDPNSLRGLALARYKPDGGFDPSFGHQGRVTMVVGDQGPGSGAATVDSAIDSAGRIVVLADGSSYHAHLVRFTPNGKLDKTFSSEGMSPKLGEDAFELAIDSQDRIVAGTTTSDCGSTPSSACIERIWRYKANGTPDKTFSGDGVVLGPSLSVAIDSAGRIVAGGDALVVPGFPGGGGYPALVRLTPNGSPDTTFGSGDGEVDLDWSPWSVTTDSADRIVAAREDHVARFEVNGDADSGFGSGGVATTGFGADSDVYSVGVDPDGRIVTAGFAGEDFALAALQAADGSLDPTFGTSGQVTTAFGAMDSFASDLTVDSSGGIIAVGAAGSGARYLPWGPRAGFQDSSRFALARYLSGGGLDPSFGNGGRVTTTSFPPETSITKATIQSQQRTARFRFVGVGERSGFKCKLRSKAHPNPAFSACSSPKVYSGLPVGSYTFEVQAVGGSLGPDPTPAQRTFTIK